MKKLTLLLAMGVLSWTMGAQVDKSTTTVKAPEGLRAPEKKAETEDTSVLKIEGNHSLSKKTDFFNTFKDYPLGEEEKKPFSMRMDNGLMTYQPKDFKPKAFQDKEMKEEYRKDQYLGDLVTGGSIVEIYCRDHEYVDGDKVRVYLNGKVIDNNVSLGGGYYPVLVRLDEGFNTIVFEALNQGTSGPNTAELRVFDASGVEVAKKEWNLMTGGKAQMVVVKQ